MFDFSDFKRESSKRPIEFLGLTEAETKALLSQKHGISNLLMDRCQHHTMKGTDPNAATKCLIVFEAYGHDTTYEEIAEGCGISRETAVQHMAKVRKWVAAALKLKIEHGGNRIFLVSNETLAQKAERLDCHLQRMNRVMESLVSDVNSIRQSGQVPVLKGTAAKVISAYEQAKQIEGAKEADQPEPAAIAA